MIPMIMKVLEDGTASQRRFEVFHFDDRWRRGRTSGGCGNEGFGPYATNPQFFVNLSGMYLKAMQSFTKRLVQGWEN